MRFRLTPELNPAFNLFSLLKAAYLKIIIETVEIIRGIEILFISLKIKRPLSIIENGL